MMLATCAPTPPESEMVAVEGIWSIMPEPSELMSPSMPCIAASSEFFISWALTANSPFCLLSVEAWASHEISQTLNRYTGANANDAHCEPVPRPMESALPVPCEIAEPDCTRNGTRNDARVVPPAVDWLDTGTFVASALNSEYAVVPWNTRSGISLAKASNSTASTAASSNAMIIS